MGLRNTIASGGLRAWRLLIAQFPLLKQHPLAIVLAAVVGLAGIVVNAFVEKVVQGAPPPAPAASPSASIKAPSQNIPPSALQGQRGKEAEPTIEYLYTGEEAYPFDPGDSGIVRLPVSRERPLNVVDIHLINSASDLVEPERLVAGVRATGVIRRSDFVSSINISDCIIPPEKTALPAVAESLLSSLGGSKSRAREAINKAQSHSFVRSPEFQGGNVDDEAYYILRQFELFGIRETSENFTSLREILKITSPEPRNIPQFFGPDPKLELVLFNGESEPKLLTGLRINMLASEPPPEIAGGGGAGDFSFALPVSAKVVLDPAKAKGVVRFSDPIIIQPKSFLRISVLVKAGDPELTAYWLGYIQMLSGNEEIGRTNAICWVNRLHQPG
ncbi:hypothetical protein [Caulobacter sp. 602-1]|uniref:hypothetical protein n=1 Tax=Caulobacter sp. 602-1 TaxID=2492472 RepID=UPI000F62D1DD|nr:hypothetical protein [Caulobacter sp. 602-1]RRN62209.1 hypothetical protein EIK80_22775 [Caulobacter sp. 602-1]